MVRTTPADEAKQRRLSRIDEIVLSLYARGLTTGDIAAHFAEIFDAQVSKDTISRITDRVVEEMQAWTSRPLERVYAAVVVDAINVKVRDGQVANRPVYAAIGVDPEGHKDILGMWISGGGGESAKFWMVVLTELRNHGVAVFFLVCDGLKGLPDSVNAVWFATIVQTCLIHLIRNSFRFASRKYWDGLSRDLNRAQRYWLRPRRRRPVTREEGCAMPRKQQLTWTVVLRLAVVVTGCAGLVVLGGGTALWVVEGKRPDSTMRSWGDALWWSLTTLTTVGYGDQVPVTTTGRLIAAGVMVAGVAVIGAVAAIVALAVALRVARQEELAFEAAAEILEQRLDVRLARIEAQLAGLDARLQAWSTASADDDVCSKGDDQ